MQFFRLAADEYVNDPHVRALTIMQRGILIELWCRSAMGYELPADVDQLRAISAPELPQEAFDRIWLGSGRQIGISRFFTVDPDDPTCVVSERLEADRERMLHRRKTARDNVRQRWSKKT